MEEKIIDETKQGEAIQLEHNQNNTKKVFLESYGCQMTTTDVKQADLILLNTCSIRDKAEQTVRKRLSDFQNLKKNNKNLTVGVLGCMAERLKAKFLEEEKLVDLVVGPDAYKDLPNLLKETNDGRSAINVILSKEETYGDIQWSYSFCYHHSWL